MTLLELGSALRAEREQKGLSANEVASRLKLSAACVEGIETGNLDAFPHLVYARGFIKAYAELMHIPADMVQEAIAEVAADEPAFSSQPPLLETVPAWRESGTGGRIFVWIVCVLIAAAVVILAVMYREDILNTVTGFVAATETAQQSPETQLVVLSIQSEESAAGNTNSSGVEAVSSDPRENLPESASPSSQESGSPLSEQRVPASTDGIETEPAVSAVPGHAEGSSPASAAESFMAETSGTPSSADISTSVNNIPLIAVSESQNSVPSEKTVSETGSSSTPDTQRAVTDNRHTLQFTGLERVWLSLRPKGGRSRSMELRTGETFLYEFDQPVTVRLGNAGGVRIVFDGTSLPLAGRSGEVVNLTFPR